MSHHSYQNPREPDDLLVAQQDLTQVRADLADLIKNLPYSVEPMEAWQRPDGYWQNAPKSYPDSPGWSEQEQTEVVGLRERERTLAASIVTHAFWDDVASTDLPDARSQLKHVRRGDGEGQESL
ncbi:nucleic acid-binding protein [Streptomyces monashensis]|uniref:Nucleic acid-binding protein n=1 Tax=Streptomyces monashensis TaxID=1678012 RepID=A0A1S2QRZ7_9ACTN|nr:nucleic acid-binding protein [Streptomyces monashensis]OIK08226.1 nucleic acid-binding protein [Streptomyces monashensis]